MKIKVKNLPWQVHESPNEPNVYVAKTVFCRYRVWNCDGYGWIAEWSYPGYSYEVGDKFSTAQDAMDASQSHHEKRIMENIEITEEELK